MSDGLHHDSAHSVCQKELRQTSWATTVQSILKWAVAELVINHRALMWNPSTWASFPLFENFPAVFHFSKYKFILFKHNSELLSALLSSFLHSRNSCQGTRYENLHHHTASVPSRLPTACSVKSKFLTTGLEALHPLTCTHIPGGFPLQRLLHSIWLYPDWVLASPWINLFLLMLVLCPGSQCFCAACLVKSYKPMKVQTRSCPSSTSNPT